MKTFFKRSFNGIVGYDRALGLEKIQDTLQMEKRKVIANINSYLEEKSKDEFWERIRMSRQFLLENLTDKEIDRINVDLVKIIDLEKTKQSEIEHWKLRTNVTFSGENNISIHHCIQIDNFYLPSKLLFHALKERDPFFHMDELCIYYLIKKIEELNVVVYMTLDGMENLVESSCVKKKSLFEVELSELALYPRIFVCLKNKLI